MGRVEKDATGETGGREGRNKSGFDGGETDATG